MRSRFLTRTLGVLLAGLPLTAQDLTSTAAALLRGVDAIDVGGAVPGPLCVFGTNAEPVLLVRERKGATADAVVAIATGGKGRLAVLGHGAFLGKSSLASSGGRALVQNLLAWLAGDSTSVRVAIAGNRDLRAFLVAEGGRWQVTSARLEALDEVDLLVFDDFDRISATETAKLGEFVQRGGALLTTGLGWGWLQLHPGKTLVDGHAGNRFLRGFGIAFADGTTPARFAPAKGESGLVHARRALAALRESPKDRARLAQIGATLGLAAGALPVADPFVAELVKLVAERGAVTITESAPLGEADAVGRLSVRIAHLLAQNDGSGTLRADPSAADFPGLVPADAPRVTRAVRVDLARPGWASTGLHAAPGEFVTAKLGAAAPQGLRLRIGCHTDELWQLPTWKRHPEITRSVPFRGEAARAGSPFGGLVYVEVPRGGSGVLTVEIAGAVAAPHFVRGVTTNAEWKARIRSAPGPWAEFEANQVIVTVRSEHVRALDDAQRVVEFWDRVLDCYAELGTRPNRVGPERMVTDRQISAGYMHSGYPIMTHLDVGARFLDVDGLVRDPDEGWGFWHELGHNHQQGEWTFEGTGEVTCNLFSLFVIEKLGGAKPMANTRFAQLPRTLAKYRKDGARFATWQSDPFLALAMYVQLQDAFGWNAFQKVFAEYRDAPRSELPKHDAAKRDQWMVRFSRVVGHDLGPFFAAWGIPVSEAARREIADLPAWMPPELPRR